MPGRRCGGVLGVSWEFRDCWCRTFPLESQEQGCQHQWQGQRPSCTLFKLIKLRPPAFAVFACVKTRREWQGYQSRQDRMEEEAHLANTFLELHPPTNTRHVNREYYTFVHNDSEREGWPIWGVIWCHLGTILHTGLIDLFNMMWHFFSFSFY